MKKNLFLTFAILLSIALVISFASAQLGVPHQFYGTVIYNSASAPDGVSVVAKIDGITVKETTTLDGKYGYNPLFFVTDPDEGRVGKTIVFYVNNIESSSFIFSNGKVTELNLAASGSPINDGSDENSGGNGGGPSGGPTFDNSTNQLADSDSEANNDEEILVNEDQKDKTGTNWLTGAIIGAFGGVGFFSLLVLLVLVAVGIVLFFVVKKSKKESGNIKRN